MSMTILSSKGTNIALSKKILFSSIVILSLSTTSCKKEAVLKDSSNETANTFTADAGKTAILPPNFGAWISGYAIDDKMNACSMINVTYVRDAIELKSFTGKSSTLDGYVKNGYKLLLNFVYQNASGGKAVPFPTDMTEYRKLLNNALDKYTPEVAVIENEPTTDKFHSGPIENYITELKAAVAVCKQRGVKVADGALNLQWVQTVMNGYSSPDPNYTETKKLIEAYKTIDLDYINIHTHAPFNKGDNPDVFPPNVAQKVADYLRRETGKEVICNEYNQYNTSTALMNSAVSAFAAGGYKYFIAHSNDNDGKGKALYSSGNLTEIGVAYKNAVK